MTIASVVKASNHRSIDDDDVLGPSDKKMVLHAQVLGLIFVEPS